MTSGHLYRFEATFTDLVPIGLVPEGLRLDPHFSGSVVDGDFAGASVRGTDYLLFRSDGVGVLDVWEVLATESGSVSVRAGGYLLPPTGFELPPPEVLLSEEFQWPDIALPIHGFAVYRTGAAGLELLNRTIATFTGEVNPGLGTSSSPRVRSPRIGARLRPLEAAEDRSGSPRQARPARLETSSTPP